MNVCVLFGVVTVCIVVPPPLKVYVNGPIPPVTLAVSVAEPGVQIVADDELRLADAD